jgi:hypothetical protein
MTFLEACNREYQALLLMLCVSYRSIEEHGVAARVSGDVGSARTSAKALTALLEATLGALNAHVDSAIVSCALVTKPTVPTVAEHRASREENLTALEGRFAFDRRDLPQWGAVKNTNDQTNALKHRLGLTIRRGAAAPLSIEEAVELTEPVLLQRIDDVHEWVVSLGRACDLN